MVSLFLPYMVRHTQLFNLTPYYSLTESEQATPVNSIKDVVWSSVKVPEFDKHLKKAGRHIGWNVVEITTDEDNSPKTLNDKTTYIFLVSWFYLFIFRDRRITFT